jgi:23S rRNA pseudouridine1911/1915/1917 synthase
MSFPAQIILPATPADSGKRLDRFLAERLPDYSRSRIQAWIRVGRVRIDGKRVKASLTLHGEESVGVDPAAAAPLHATPEDLPLDILYEDADLVAVNKQAGMVVHAGAGVRTGTLVNALLHRYGSLSAAGGEERPGIVHRLDRFTSGVLLVARNEAAHRALAEQFAARQVEKVYIALVHGNVRSETGRIDRRITRDPRRRIRMTARLETGRVAFTEFHVTRRFEKFTLLEVRIGTGRTHQIRVHLASLGHPVAGDSLYGAPARIPGSPPLGRYFLHARRITFRHPATGASTTIEAPLPPELNAFLDGL